MHHPAGKLSSQCGLAFAALATHHGVAFCSQQPLEREQLPAAPDEAGLRHGRQFAETSRERGLEVLHRLLRGRYLEKLRVVLFLEKDGHGPIFELQRACAEDLSTEGVVLESALACEHGVAHASASNESFVKRLDEPASGLDKHAVAHGRSEEHTSELQSR